MQNTIHNNSSNSENEARTLFYGTVGIVKSQKNRHRLVF